MAIQLAPEIAQLQLISRAAILYYSCNNVHVPFCYCIVIATQPVNSTVCVGEGASFTCVVDRDGGVPVTAAGWQLFDVAFIPVVGRDRHMTNATMNGDIITDVLTVSDVLLSDDGAQYRCRPLNDDETSNTVFLNVIGKDMYVCMYYMVLYI